MKCIISLVIFLFFIFSANSQVHSEKYEGKYVYRGVGTVQIINLKSKGIFESEFYSSFTFPNYIGKWSLKNNRLILSAIGENNFKCRRYIQNNCYPNNTSDSIFFHVFDNNGNPIVNHDELRIVLENDTVLSVNPIEYNKYGLGYEQFLKEMELIVFGYKRVSLNLKQEKGNCVNVYFKKKKIKLPYKGRKVTIRGDSIIVRSKKSEMVFKKSLPAAD